MSPIRRYVTFVFVVLISRQACLAARPPSTRPGGPPEGVSQTLVLAPGPGNPRNSEGDFITLKDGRILFLYTRFTGGAGDLLLVWNDHAGIIPALRGKRTPLTVAVSRDEGKTWVHRKTLYDDPTGWYCYTAIAFAGDRVMLAHCAGQQVRGSSGLATTVVTCFDLDWLYR